MLHYELQRSQSPRANMNMNCTCICHWPQATAKHSPALCSIWILN